MAICSGYNAFMKRYKEISSKQGNEYNELIDKVKYQDEYSFHINESQYSKLIADLILGIVISGILSIIFILGAINASNIGTLIFSVIMSLSFIVLLVALCWGTYNKYNNIYPKQILQYKKGTIHYNDGKVEYDFNVKSIYSIRFSKPYFRNDYWILQVNLKASHDVMDIDILRLNNHRLIYFLLTNYAQGLKVS